MNVLALDLGTKCGYASSLGKSGVWNLKPSTHESAGERYRKFRMYLEGFPAKIDFVVYEEVHKHIGTEAAHCYGGLMAILQTWCIDNRIEFKGVGVGSIKKHATGKGNAEKDDMVFAMSLKYKSVNIIDHNHADALALLSYAQEIIFCSRQPSGHE
jgi:Holliday junction resolvasome RuvABC endonuclease subunit